MNNLLKEAEKYRCTFENLTMLNEGQNVTNRIQKHTNESNMLQNMTAKNSRTFVAEENEVRIEKTQKQVKTHS